MSNIIWSLESIQKLIELLHAHPYIWNRDLRQFSHRQTREKGLQKIANELNMTTQAVKNKLSNLKSRYKSESMKVETSRKSGSFYRPTLSWYSDFRDLMLTAEQDYYKPVSTTKKDIEEEEMPPSSDDEEDEFDYDGEDNSNPNTIVVTIRKEFLDKARSGSVDPNVDFVAKTYKRKYQKPQQNITMSDMCEDEFQMFALHIAEQLKQLPLETAIVLQNNIQNMLDEASFVEDSS